MQKKVDLADHEITKETILNVYSNADFRVARHDPVGGV